MNAKETPAARRASLLARIRTVAGSAPGREPARRVQLTVAMDRFLVRLLATTEPGAWVLKGGYANLLRAPSEARFTQDLDLRLDVPLEVAEGVLGRAAQLDLDDLFTYEFAGPPQPLIGPPGGGFRFAIRTLLGGSDLVRFGIDVNSTDAVVGERELHPSDPLVTKLGFAPAEFPVYPLAQQFAEKLHAFTRPRDRENTRVKDLADMVWFVERAEFESARLIDAGEATFGRRGEHPWPPAIPVVPASWTRPYAALRAEMGIAPQTAGAARDVLAAFLRPVLAGDRTLRSAQGGAWGPLDQSDATG